MRTYARAYLGNGRTYCAEIWYVVVVPLSIVLHVLQVEDIARAHVRTTSSCLSNRWTLYSEIRRIVRYELTTRFTQVIGGEYFCTSARAPEHPFKQIYSFPPVHRPKDVLLVLTFCRHFWRIVQLYFLAGWFINNVTNTKRNISENNACMFTKIVWYNLKVIRNMILSNHK